MMTSSGLHGVGVSVVNALSDTCEVEVARGQQLYRMVFSRGIPQTKLEKLGPVMNRRGTKVRFHPDETIFGKGAHFKPARLFKMARSKAYLFGGVKIRWSCDPALIKDDTPSEAEFHFPGGLKDYLASEIAGQTLVTKDLFAGSIEREGKHGSVEWAVAWISDEDGFCRSYCNTIPTAEGGTHENGFRSALSKSLREFGDRVGNRKAAQITAEDVMGTAAAMLSVFIREPEFQGQTKDKLATQEASRIVESAVKDAFDHWLTDSPQQATRLLEWSIDQAEERLKRRREKEVGRQSATRKLRLPGKLADCSIQQAAGTEIFIVEGDSAGGSAKSARVRETQAILPLRGKILNVANASSAKLAQNQLLADLIQALGVGTGSKYRDDDLRYERVIVMTDADVDGAHIRTLLLTFFYRQMPELVEKGHVYIAQPPLYKVSRGKSGTYLKDQRALEDYLIDSGLEDTVLVAGGSERGGKDLRDIVDQARGIVGLIDQLHSRYSRLIVEQAAIAGAFDPVLLQSSDSASAAANTVAARLNEVAEETEKGWSGVYGNDGFLFRREVRGVTEAHALDRALLASLDARRLNEKRAHLAEVYGLGTKLRRKAETLHILGPRSLLNAIYEAGRKGLSLQRYKGLGEMNPEQLWETTLDRDVRTLLQVKIGDVSEVDEIFSKLMGDVVEPRREFIQENALTVANLDV